MRHSSIQDFVEKPLLEDTQEYFDRPESFGDSFYNTKMGITIAMMAKESRVLKPQYASPPIVSFGQNVISDKRKARKQ